MRLHDLASSSMSATDTTTHASIGRGNPSLLPCRRVSTDRLSIVDRLAARSVTGRGLQILVHQHYGYLLHLEWGSGSSSRDSSRFMERRLAKLKRSVRDYVAEG